jgi:hypothetical protein
VKASGRRLAEWRKRIFGSSSIVEGFHRLNRRITIARKHVNGNIEHKIPSYSGLLDEAMEGNSDSGG